MVDVPRKVTLADAARRTSAPHFQHFNNSGGIGGHYLHTLKIISQDLYSTLR